MPINLPYLAPNLDTQLGWFDIGSQGFYLKSAVHGIELALPVHAGRSAVLPPNGVNVQTRHAGMCQDAAHS
jgi:hypothetical protein